MKKWEQEVKNAEFNLFKQEATAEVVFKDDIDRTGLVFHIQSYEVKMFIKSMGYLFTATPSGDCVHIINHVGKQVPIKDVLEELIAEKPYLLKHRGKKKPKRR